MSKPYTVWIKDDTDTLNAGRQARGSGGRGLRSPITLRPTGRRA